MVLRREFDERHVTEGVARWKAGEGRRECVKEEEWHGERGLRFTWTGPRIPHNVVDVHLWKRTRWLVDGAVFDEELEELHPWSSGDNQGTLRVRFAGSTHALHRVVAFLFSNRQLKSGRYLTWKEFNRENAYEVNHKDRRHWNSVAANLEVLTKVEHMRLDGRRPG